MMKSLKFLPVIGSIISLYSAYTRFKTGDWVGGLVDGGAAIAGLVPGIGTAISWGLTLFNAGRDLSGATEERKKMSEVGAFTDSGYKEMMDERAEIDKKYPKKSTDAENTTLKTEESVALREKSAEEMRAEMEAAALTEERAALMEESSKQVEEVEQLRKAAEAKKAENESRPQANTTTQKIDELLDVLKTQQASNNAVISNSSSANTVNYLNNNQRDIAHFERNVARNQLLDYKYGY